MRLKVISTLVLACTAALALGASAAKAADVTVGLGRCAFLQGGQTTVPAGSTIIARLRNGEVNRGMVENFIHAQRTTLSLNGGSPIDISEPATVLPPGGVPLRMLPTAGC